MSWDLLLLPLPTHLASVDELPDDFSSHPLGPREHVTAALLDRIPAIDFSDPTWGHLAGPTWSVELNIGSAYPVDSMMLHVRGSHDDALPLVFRIADTLGCRVIDISENTFLSPGDTSSRHSFQDYRDRVIRES